MQEPFKTIDCRECREPVRAKLLVGEREFLDGYHGECQTCGWNFEPIEDDKEASPCGILQAPAVKVRCISWSEPINIPVR